MKCSVIDYYSFSYFPPSYHGVHILVLRLRLVTRRSVIYAATEHDSGGASGGVELCVRETKVISFV